MNSRVVAFYLENVIDSLSMSLVRTAAGRRFVVVDGRFFCWGGGKMRLGALNYPFNGGESKLMQMYGKFLGISRFLVH